MPSLYDRIFNYAFFAFADMHTQVRNFIFQRTARLLKAWKGSLPTKSSGDTETGLLDAIQSPPTNKSTQHSSYHERAEDRTAVPEDDIVRSQKTSLTLARPVGPDQQPQCTDGPARFVIVNDGSRDCLALLVTETFITKSRDLYEDSHHLAGKQGPLQHVRRDARNAEESLDLVIDSLEVAESQEQANKLEVIAKQRESELIEARKRKSEIKKGTERLKSSIAASRAYTQWVLETAMEEANLLEPHRPLTPFMIADNEDDTSPSELYNQSHNGHFTNEDEAQETTQDEYCSRQEQHARPNDVEPPATSGDVLASDYSIRQAAWDDYNDKLETFHKIQAIFDDRHEAYEANLAKYQDGVKNGIYQMSRSDFDRNRIRHGQKITRALIDAEEAVDAAKTYAQAVGAMGSEYGPTNCLGNYEESMPDSQMASYNASTDFSHIYSWMVDVPEMGECDEFEPVDVDDWDAKEMDQTDSISQIDFEEYRKPIDRWQYECALTRGEGPEEYYLGPVNIEFLERRHSVSFGSL